MVAGRSRIHLIHSASDKRFASLLARDLRARGRDVWYAEWEILDALASWESLLERVEDEVVLGFVLSDGAAVSSWLATEIDEALKVEMAARRIQRMVIVAGDCEVPGPLARLGIADFRDDHDAGLEAVLAAQKDYDELGSQHMADKPGAKAPPNMLGKLDDIAKK